MNKPSESHLWAVLRIALGLVFVIGGRKLAFHPDPPSLAASYIDPDSGYIATTIGEAITGGLGVSIETFLATQGWIEIVLGALFIVGLFTRPVAVVTGLLFLSFAAANPVVGAIRLSRDLSLAALCFAVAIGGSGGWSADTRWRGLASRIAHRDGVLATIRVAIGFALVVSALFAGGVFDNPLNTSLPRVAVLLAGALLLLGIVPRWIVATVVVWMVVLALAALADRGFLVGIDAVKRELGFLAAGLAYAALGPDRWAFPRIARLSSPGGDTARD